MTSSLDILMYFCTHIIREGLNGIALNLIWYEHYAIRGYIKLVLFKVRFQVLMAASLKITALWNIAPCSLIEVDRYSTHHPDAGSSTSVYFSKIIGCCIPQGCNLRNFQFSTIANTNVTDAQTCGKGRRSCSINPLTAVLPSVSYCMN
jgi:hypothetical protein